ncbi:MAG TPA: DUF2470 domain-containing protein [Pararhizobium sp.]|nr:DUF2470 domain-containing protein [Pararhizobium sp.]
MPERKDVIRETDEDARRLARILVRSARFAALAVFDPKTRHPFASRVLIGTDSDGAPVTLISGLSAHTLALNADPRASILVGEPGKGDPLAHPRLTVQCRAERIPPESEARARLRRRFISRHPKAALYADFGDFAFFRLQPLSASLNAGFGRAYDLPAEDLLIPSPAAEAIAAIEADAIAHMNQDHPDAADTYAREYAGARSGHWRFCSLDAAGFDLQSGDALKRIEFAKLVENTSEMRTTLSGMLKQTR